MTAAKMVFDRFGTGQNTKPAPLASCLLQPAERWVL